MKHLALQEGGHFEDGRSRHSLAWIPGRLEWGSLSQFSREVPPDSAVSPQGLSVNRPRELAASVFLSAQVFWGNTCVLKYANRVLPQKKKVQWSDHKAPEKKSKCSGLRVCLNHDTEEESWRPSGLEALPKVTGLGAGGGGDEPAARLQGLDSTQRAYRAPLRKTQRTDRW